MCVRVTAPDHGRRDPAARGPVPPADAATGGRGRAQDFFLPVPVPVVPAISDFR